MVARLATALVLAFAAPARAEVAPLVLPEHEVAVAVTAEASLDAGAYLTPISLAPDLWFGLTARWTVGVIHSDATVDRIGTGAGMCLQCDRAYRGGGVEARWSWQAGELAIAPRVRFLVRELAPVEPAVTLGALARWTHGRFSITSDPYLRVGLANGDMNPPAIILPVWFEVQPARRWSAAIHTGWGSSLPVVHDAWHIPFALDLRVHASAAIDLGVEAGFTSLLGPDNRRQERSITLGVAWHG